MKTRILFFILTIFIMSFNQAQEKLAIDTSKSELKWSGEYTFYFGGHNGTISLIDGYFIKNKDAITGGEFIIDMTSISCDDIEKTDANESLVNHLKDQDFFDVAKFPESRLIITKVTYSDSTHMKIDADLTIKGKTLPIVFYAEVDFEKQQLSTRFKIDRMRWNVNYNSKMRDGAISDAIGFEVKLKLKQLDN